MRVIAGEKRRYILATPKGDKIRPTSDIIKETLFNMIEPIIFSSIFCDLCAGTGQIGIEAISRGAKLSLFVDKDRQAIDLINKNLTHTELSDRAIVIQGSVPTIIKRLEAYSPNIFFLDPPYDKDIYEETIGNISKLDSFNSDCLIIAEAAKVKDFSFVSNYNLYIEKEKTYKSSKHIFIRRENE